MPKSDQEPDGIDWRLTTWEGSRREQLRRWAALPLERIIMAIEEMQDLSEHFRQMRESGKPYAPQLERDAARESHTVLQNPGRYDSGSE